MIWSSEGREQSPYADRVPTRLQVMAVGGRSTPPGPLTRSVRRRGAVPGLARVDEKLATGYLNIRGAAETAIYVVIDERVEHT